MMTDAQLEAAARKYCAVLGLDPDHTVCDTDTTNPETGLSYWVPRWKVLMKEVRRYAAMVEALHHVGYIAPRPSVNEQVSKDRSGDG